jgi:hypothetical protein
MSPLQNTDSDTTDIVVRIFNKSHRRAGATLDFLIALKANKEMFD